MKISEAPRYWKYVTLPFMLVAAPFAYAADKLTPEGQPGPEVPRLETMPAPPPAPAPRDYETASLERLEDELDRRAATRRSPHQPRRCRLRQRRRRRPAPRSRPGPPHPTRTRSRPSSRRFASRRLPRTRPRRKPWRHPPRPRRPAPALRLRRPLRAPRPEPPPQPTRTSPSPRARSIATATAAPTSGSRARTARSRARPSTRTSTVVPTARSLYDLAHRTRSVQIEEDANFDGTDRRLDRAATAARSCAGARTTTATARSTRGAIYRGGVITRLERDANGDGFRDHVATYQDGRLAREERDDDGDGRTDLISYFDDAERVARVEEDSNGDGEMDVVSHYEDGRLARREVLDASVLGARARAARRSSSSAAHAGPGDRVPVRALARAVAVAVRGARGETRRRSGSYADSRRRCTAA